MEYDILSKLFFDGQDPSMRDDIEFSRTFNPILPGDLDPGKFSHSI